jgi:hypothetical protein
MRNVAKSAELAAPPYKNILDRTRALGLNRRSASGQTQKLAVAIVRSGLPPKAHSTRRSRHVRKVPIGDLETMLTCGGFSCSTNPCRGPVSADMTLFRPSSRANRPCVNDI